MAYDIIIGRDKADKELLGKKGLVFLGKGYVKMGQSTSLSNNIFLDVARSHVILVAGKRGSGKSHSLGVIAEELSMLEGDASRNIASIIFDTMGIFWTMKFENIKDKPMLRDWSLEPKNIPVRIFCPYGKLQEYRDKNIPVDEAFALKASELETEDWLTTFGLSMISQEGVLIQRVINKLKKERKEFTLVQIQEEIEGEHKFSPEVKNIASSLFSAADSWGIFSKEKSGTEIKDLLKRGSTTVIDLSVYSSIGSFNVRALVIGLISRKLFQERINARKKEEIESIHHGIDFAAYSSNREVPLVWLFVDEAHEFLPKDGKTAATEALVQILREGRQPGISLVLATQQPGEINKDVLTQSDVVIGHRVTAKQDIEALNTIMQTYLLESIKRSMDDLPGLKGSAIILDDNSERIYPTRIRPRLTWHGGESPTAVKPDTEI